MRGRLRAARRARASRPAPSTPPRCASSATSGRTSTAPSCPTLTESKLGLLADGRRAASGVQRRPGAAARPGLRDRVGQGQQRPPRRLRPGRAAHAAARSTGHDPETVGRRLRQLRGGQARPGPDGHGGRPAAAPPGMLAEDERVAAQVRRQYKWFVVDEFQDVSPIQSALLDLWLGGRDELCVVGDPAQTIYSFAGADADYLRDFPTQVPRHHLDRAGPQLPLHPRGGRGGQHPARRHRRAAGVELRAQQPAGPDGRPTRRTPTRSPRPRRSPPQSRRLRDGGARRRARSPCCSASTPSPRRSRRRWPARGIPYVVRGAARFFDRPEVREAVTRLRGAARGRRGRRPRRRWPTPVARDPRRRWAGRPRPRPPAARPATAGSRWQALVDQADRVRGRATAAPTSTASSTSSTAAPPSSTPRSPTASPWPPSTPPRAWSGTPCSCAACRRAPCRSPTPRRPTAVEEERRLLYVGMTRARVAPRAVLGAGPQPGRPRHRASPPGSSTRCCPTTARGRP